MSSSSWRFERKFAIEELDAPEVIHALRVHPWLFREIHHERQVLNVYLDDHRLAHYFANLDGDGRFRHKVRVRWYEPDDGERSVLEIKERRGQLNRKRSRTLEGWSAKREGIDALLPFLRHSLGDDAHDPALHGMRPTLLNRYRRRYFASADGEFRATVDWDLGFAAATPRSSWRPLHGLCILELKYAPEVAERANSFGEALRMRSTRCSKYVMGIEREIAWC